MIKWINKLYVISIICFFSFASYSFAEDEQPIMLGLGDSIGEGVQSADANLITQQFSYLNFLAWKINIPFNLPLITTGPLGVVGDTSNRSRLDPFLIGHNLAVSGADVHSLLFDRADALDISEINSETDLVLFPRLGSQIEIAESVGAPLIVCWIGNNDVLSAAISFDRLDASQMTPIGEFSIDFLEIVQRLSALSGAVVFANIPDVTNIGFLVDRQDLIRFVGSDYGLQEGDFTSIVVMLLIRLGLDDGSLIQDPDFVLDAGEVVIIQQRINVFNQIIQAVADAYNYPVVDMNTLFHTIGANPPTILGIPITDRFLGGLFSLDGVHPSNFGHALVANAFIEKINEHYEANIPLINETELLITFLTDPFVDKDGDGRTTGRFGFGLLETLGPFLGISGDEDDLTPQSFSFEKYYAPETPRPEMEDVISAFKHIFGLRTFDKQ